MAIELVTGYQGKDHVTAEQWADFNRGIFGDAAILPVGNRMETAIQTANQITVKDGVAVFDGREVYIGYGESENIAIVSGTQGMMRRDIVVVEYTREEDTGIESVQFKVVNGTPAASNAKDPSVQDMDIRTGVFVSQKPFCRVRLNGTAIEGVDSLVQVKEFKDHAFSDPVNNLTGTDSALALAAPQGRALKQLIDQLNSALAVTSSQVSIGTDVTVGTHNLLRKSGNLVQIILTVNNKWEWEASRELRIGNVPTGFRPSTERFGHGVTKGKITFGYSVYSNGTILFWPNEKLIAEDEICFNTTWVI